MDNQFTGSFRGRGHVITTLLLFGAMIAICFTSLRVTVSSFKESSAREYAAKKAAFPAQSFEELSQAFTSLKAQAAAIAPSDYQAYFNYLRESRKLESIAAVSDGENGDYRTRGLVMQIRPLEMNTANTFMTAFTMDPKNTEIMRSESFLQAQGGADAFSRGYNVPEGPAEYSWASLAGVWGMALLCCMPFALLGMALQIQRDTGESWPVVGMLLLSNLRLLPIALTGPFSLAITWFTLQDRRELAVNMRYLSFVLSSFMSLFVYGGAAGVAKAQSPSTKKVTTSFTERVESDESGSSSTSIAGLTYLPTGSSAEAIVVKGSGFMRTYGLYVQKLRTYKRRSLAMNISSVGGVMTFSSKSGTAVYAVAGARVGLSTGRFFWNTPHIALEAPLSRKTRTTSAVISKVGFALNNRVTIINEWFGRFTVGAKPKITSYVLLNVKIGKRYNFEVGPYRTNSGLTGMRTQFGFSF